MMPLCSDNEDCHYPGYFCASLAKIQTRDLLSREVHTEACHGIKSHQANSFRKEARSELYGETKPFCFECRVTVCANSIFNGTETSRFGPTGDNAAFDCIAEVDPQGATLRTCYPMAQVDKLGNVTAYFVIFLVAVGLAVAIMSEKRQMLIQGRILNLALEIPSTADPVLCYIMKGVNYTYEKYVTHKPVEAQKHASMRTKRSIMKLARNNSSQALSTADYNVFHEWMEVEIPGAPHSRAALRNKMRFVMILCLSELTFLRRQLVLALVPMTVSSLIMFEGADPLSVLLNGLATVFLLELDDAIGEAAFTATYRGRVIGRIEAAVSTIQNLDAHSKVDNLCCYIDGWVSTMVIFNNVFLWRFYYPGQTCVSILLWQLVTAGVINVIAQLSQEILRREYFYFKVVAGKRDLSRTARGWAGVLKKRGAVVLREVGIDVVSGSCIFGLATLVMYIMTEIHNGNLAWDLLFFDMADCPEWQPHCIAKKALKARASDMTASQEIAALRNSLT